MPNSFAPKLPKAALVLADGTVFQGYSFGSAGMSAGELVFNTAMTGYQEILSDPSYAKQIVTLTYPQIGNTGFNREDMESEGLHIAGLIVRALPAAVSSWRTEGSLSDLLKSHDKIGLVGIDTRHLTSLLREQGAQPACLVAADGLEQEPDIEAALAAAREFTGLAGLDLAKVVTVASPYVWEEGTWVLGKGYPRRPPAPEGTVAAEEGRRFKVVAYDFGVKRNILRLLVDHGCDVTVVPATTPATDVLAMNPEGIFLSNGPGDPQPCTYAVEAIRIFLDRKIPVFGICLGHQLLALAAGARTMKMKFGHHGANHPVKDLSTGGVAITSQNHGFAVDADSLPSNMHVTHVSLFDGSIQGVALEDAPAFSFQGHPEASPGPNDITYLFEQFARSMADRRQ
ncbi:MAG: glutamine-hydrolyzing carbamoyl-phosphate synthase small subunit [Lautropia sp.]|nr:glutamine-hydrolyzing carbamoyl-phosphate synthase small subunit [Lautropia sp.]